MDEEELDACQDADGTWKCTVSTCGHSLSRKQTLQNHLSNIHNIAAGQAAKKYKLYETDGSIPVPKSTHHRLLAGLRQDGSNHNDTSSPASNEDEDTTFSFENFDEVEMDIDSPDTAIECDEEYATPNNSESDEETEETINSCSTTSTDKTENPPLYVIAASAQPFQSPISRDEHIHCTSALGVRHNLSDMAIKDVLKLLQLHMPDNNIGERNIHELKEKCGFNKDYVKYNLYCDSCKKLFSDDSESCKTPGCQGSKTDPDCQKYFVTSSLTKQLQEILQRRGIWPSISDSLDSSANGTICDIRDGSAYLALKKPGGFLHKSTNITLTMFTDGVPLFKSSAISIWPVYLLINELPPKERFQRKNMLLWGIWQGKGKPKMNMFLQPFVIELLELYNNGLSIIVEDQSITVKAMMVVITMDLQARAYITNMTQSNGEYGCLYCEEPGEVVKSGGGTCRSFPLRDELPPMRTKGSVNQNSAYALENGCRHKGFLGPSMLKFLPYFSLVDNVVIDYMHGILLGIAKKLLELWFEKKHQHAHHYIGDKLSEIDEILKGIHPPYMVHRLPRIISNTYTHWKASELRNWLLFYAVPCLKDFLPDVYFKHFCSLVEATYILLSEGITPTDSQRAEKFLRHFVASSGDLYGANFMGMNLHNLTHLVKVVQMWGPLWSWSCFAFESFNGEIKKGVHGTGNVSKQIFWSFQAQKHILQNEDQIPDGEAKAFVQSLFDRRGHNTTSEIEGYMCKIVKAIELSSKLNEQTVIKLKELIEFEDESEFMKTEKIVRNGFLMYTSNCPKVTKQNSFTISLEEKKVTGEVALEIDQFLVHKASKHVFGVGHFLKTTGSIESSYISHIVKLEYGEFAVVNAKVLREPLMIVKMKNEMYGANFPNHFERD